MTDSTNARSGLSAYGVSEDMLYKASRAWVLWLQGLFASRPAGCHKWHVNDTETEILIYSEHPTSTTRTTKRPIIVVSRGPANYAGSSRDQTMSRTLDGDEFTLSDIINTNITITCIAREGSEAQTLAYIIFRMIPVFKPTIMKAGRMHWIGNQISLGPETSHGQIVQGSSYPEWRAVQVSVPISIQDVIAVEKTFYNVLRTVNLHMGTAEEE